MDELMDAEVPAAPRPFAFIQFGAADGVARLVLNRPPANVLSVEVLAEINHALESLEYQRDVKILVVSAAGKYFSAGFELQDHLGDRAYMMLEEFRKIFEQVARFDKPTLAVVAGPALGAGSILAAGCDIVLAGAGARFGHPEIKGGVFNPVAAALLPRLVGRKKAFEMILGGGLLTAAEAEKVGLVSRVVPDEKLEAEAAAFVQRFQDGSAAILQMTRRAMAGGLDLLLPEALAHAQDVYLNQLMATEDAEEGLKAVMAKRKPAWKDK
jgi:cyclohexa-1,5-dienecarbonyl-CoA hydratase